jgi:hypothetical protein
MERRKVIKQLLKKLRDEGFPQKDPVTGREIDTDDSSRFENAKILFLLENLGNDYQVPMALMRAMVGRFDRGDDKRQRDILTVVHILSRFLKLRDPGE